MILVMSHFVYKGRVGGAEHMAYNLVKGLSQAHASPTVVCGDRANLSEDFVQDCETLGVPLVECGGKSGARFIVEQKACLDRALGADAIIFPNYYLPPIVPRRLGKTAVVIHDFQYKHFPAHFSFKKRAWLHLSHWRAMRQAKQVFYISQFVRQDAIRWFGKIAERGQVIPNPISWDRFEQPVPMPAPSNRPYILSVAAHYPHKRLDILLRAFAEFVRRRPEFQLILIGQLARNLVSVSDKTDTLAGLVSQLGLENHVRVTGYLTEAELGNYYRHAVAFAFPSIFEGFGMPAVEALGFGLRCLTTKCTALPETTMGLADYVDDPADIDEWASRLDAIVEKPRLTVDQIEKIRVRYSPMNIGNIYRSTLVYDSVGY